MARKVFVIEWPEKVCGRNYIQAQTVKSALEDFFGGMSETTVTDVTAKFEAMQAKQAESRTLWEERSPCNLRQCPHPSKCPGPCVVYDKWLRQAPDKGPAELARDKEQNNG